MIRSSSEPDWPDGRSGATLECRAMCGSQCVRPARPRRCATSRPAQVKRRARRQPSSKASVWRGYVRERKFRVAARRSIRQQGPECARSRWTSSFGSRSRSSDRPCEVFWRRSMNAVELARKRAFDTDEACWEAVQSRDGRRWLLLLLGREHRRVLPAELCRAAWRGARTWRSIARPPTPKARASVPASVAGRTAARSARSTPRRWRGPAA